MIINAWTSTRESFHETQVALELPEQIPQHCTSPARAWTLMGPLASSWLRFCPRGETPVPLRGVAAALRPLDLPLLPPGDIGLGAGALRRGDDLHDAEDPTPERDCGTKSAMRCGPRPRMCCQIFQSGYVVRNSMNNKY